jgi:hypothetical protein
MKTRLVLVNLKKTKSLSIFHKILMVLLEIMSVPVLIAGESTNCGLSVINACLEQLCVFAALNWMILP